MTAGRPKKADAKTLYGFAHQFYWDFKTLAEGLHRRFEQKLIRVPGEPDVIEQLLHASKPEQIVEICNEAFATRTIKPQPGLEVLELREQVRVPNWPISSESALPRCLSQYAAEFIAAKNDPRFPRSSRPTSRLKQLWFLSRALSGALHGIKTRTAVNLIGAMRPEEIVDLSRGAKRKRKTKKTSRKS